MAILKVAVSIESERTIMDIQATIDKVAEEVGKAPELLQEFAVDPGRAVQKITGDALGEADVSTVAAGVIARVREQGGDAMDQLSCLLENGGVHDAIAGALGKGGDLGALLNTIFSGAKE